jgi:hypothetical protein
MLPVYHPLIPMADDDDDAMKKYKQSLGLGQGTPLPVEAGDKRTCVILSLALQVSSRICSPSSLRI